MLAQPKLAGHRHASTWQQQISKPFGNARPCGRRSQCLHVVAVAVKSPAGERHPAILANDRTPAGSGDSRKKVVIVGAGWAGARSTNPQGSI